MQPNQSMFNGAEMVSEAVCKIERRGYGVREFAAMFGVSEQMVRSGIKSGQIAVIHFGRRHVIPRAEVDRLAHTVWVASYHSAWCQMTKYVSLRRGVCELLDATLFGRGILLRYALILEILGCSRSSMRFSVCDTAA